MAYNLIHFEFLSDDSLVANINFIPFTPSSILGTEDEYFFLDLIESANSVYIFAKASKKPSGCPAATLEDFIERFDTELLALVIIAVGLFSDLEILGTGLSRLEQIKAQFIGIISIGAFSFFGSYILLKILNYFYPLRVSPLHEELGLNIAEHNATSVEHDLITILEKQSESGDLTIRGPQDPFTAGGVIGLYYNRLMSKLETSEAEKKVWRDRISNEVKLAVKVQENFLTKRNLENYDSC